MKIELHNGKTMNVSQKRFEEYSRMEENNEQWLQFRMMLFGFSREELIMHPNRTVLFHGADGDFKGVCLHNGKYSAVCYGKRQHDQLFDTPEEAYEFAYNMC